MFDHVVPVGQGFDEAKVLLDQHQGQAARLELFDGPAQGLHDHRRQAFGDFVEQQQTRASAQDARQRQHLLLTAGQPRALALAPLPEVGEHGVDIFDAHAAAAHNRRQQQVFLGRQAGEDAALFRAVANAQPGNALGGHGDGLARVDPDRAGAPANQAQDRLERGAAARAVASEQAHHFARVDRQVDAVQNMRLAVEGVQARHLQGRDRACRVAAHALVPK